MVLIFILVLFFIFILFPALFDYGSNEMYMSWWKRNIDALSDQKLLETAYKIKSVVNNGQEKKGTRELYRLIKQELEKRGIDFNAD